MTPSRTLLPIGLLAAALCALASGRVAARETVPAARPAVAHPAAAESEGLSMERLRERLAEKLGATRPPGSSDPNVLRVVTKPAAPASAPR
jgi:hypothetical protein